MRAACLVFALLATTASGMEIRRQGDTVIASGEIVRRDLDRFQAEFKAAPVRSIVLRNSMGGNSWTGYRLGELFREKGVRTIVSGHCVSACSRLFLGGAVRQFSDDYPASLTYIGLHGHYEFDRLDPKASERYDQAAWTRRFTAGQVDERLMQRWMTIPHRAGDLRFYSPQAQALLGASTFLCQGHEPRRPQACERLREGKVDALGNGIVTTLALASSPDAASLPYKQRERLYPSTGFASLTALERLPSKRAAVRREYQAFLAAPLPRAFALARDGSRAAFASHDPNAPEAALKRCGGPQRCRLYAVDERVVW